MKKTKILLSSIFTIGLILAYQESASAMSPYDGAVRTTSSIELDVSEYTGSKDISTSWQKLLLDGSSDVDNSLCSSTAKSAFISALD